MHWYIKVLNQYTDFRGRSRRKEYWVFVLFNIFFSSLASILSPQLSFIYSLFVFFPSLAVLVRRLHDVGKSGWMFFIILIPLIGSIWLLILLLTDSDPEENEYGENPKSVNLNID